MKPPVYPFAAIVGQEPLKTALLLAAVDWRLGVLLRGDKGAGKTTAARALAELLPEPARFVNLPLGATEDRLLGGIDLTQTLRGEPCLRPGLLSEANGGVLYVDEINLLPDHLADALLDAAATGILTIEREGFSATHDARFVLTGSMNPEEGALRPQLLDRFALLVDIQAPEGTLDRRMIVERRMAYDADPASFANAWLPEQQRIRQTIVAGRSALSSVSLPEPMLDYISRIVSEHAIASLRADIAIARASCAQAALLGCSTVTEEHIDAVLPLALVHRLPRSRQAPLRTPQPQKSSIPPDSNGTQRKEEQNERKFSSLPVTTPALRWKVEEGAPGTVKASISPAPGAVIRTRQAEQPQELDVRRSVIEAFVHTGRTQPSRDHLYEKVREPITGARYLFVVDSSGSHAAGERMRVVKGAAIGLIERSVHRRDEVAVVAFRGSSAEILVPPTQDLETVRNALEYLPTGGRTPLAHGLDVARQLVNSNTLLLLFTDGRANVASCTDDPWSDALHAASEISCRMLVVDSELAMNAIGKARELATAIHADYVTLEDFEAGYDFSVLLSRGTH